MRTLLTAASFVVLLVVWVNTAEGKSGECPRPAKGTFGVCAEMCKSDSSCPGKQKCCSNGCGRSCTNPRRATRAAESKPGECPSTKGMIGHCAQMCKGDRYCPGNEKCCSNGCGTDCFTPKGLKSCPVPKCVAIKPSIACAMKQIINDEPCPSCFCEELENAERGKALQKACKEAGGVCKPYNFSNEDPNDRYLCKASETCKFPK